MRENLDKALRLYRSVFGSGFPMFPLKWGRTDEEVIEIINECVQKKASVYDLGYLTLDLDIMY